MRGDLYARYGLHCPWNVSGNVNSAKQTVAVVSFWDNRRGDQSAKYGLTCPLNVGGDMGLLAQGQLGIILNCGKLCSS